MKLYTLCYNKIFKKEANEKIAFNHLFGLEFDHFVKLYKNCTTDIYLILVIDTNFFLDHPIRFRRNLIKQA